MLTHFVFGAGSVVALFPALPVDLRILLAGSLSLIVNFVIDEFGHVTHGGFVARSPLTHSVLTAPLWGGLAGYGLWAVGSSLGLPGASLEVAFVAAGVVVAGAHLLLDSMTERGVYLATNRVALAHFGSGNVLLNTMFVVGGLVLFLA
jgi:hypothetical protein